MASKYKVAICRFPGSGWEHKGCVTWLMRTAVEMSRDPSIEHCELLCETDTPITMVRNLLVGEALDRGCDYILMVDSDMVPDYLVGKVPEARPFWRTAWSWMMRRREEERSLELELFGSAGPDGCTAGSDEHSRWMDDQVFARMPPATIAAPYCGPPPFESVFVFRWKDHQSDTPDVGFRLEMIEREDAAFRAGIERAAALPTGLILYDARVFRRLPRPWFDYEFDPDHKVKLTTEDVFQTRNAAMLGMPQFVLWDSWAQHVKTKLVGKPNPVTEELVHRTMAEGLSRRFGVRERLRFMSRHDVGR